MIIEVAWTTLIGSILYTTTPLAYKGFKKGAEIGKLRKAFINGELYLKRKDEKVKIKPKILKSKITDEKATFVFSIPKGVNPEKFIEKSYVFKQHFNDYIDLKVESKRGILQVYPKGLPTKFNYDYKELTRNQQATNKLELPILCGKALDGNILFFDLITNPHIIIAGETGSGKSSAIRSILTTLIQNKSPNELRLILGDLKRSEFHLFKHLHHVDGVYHSAKELYPVLKNIKREMAKRGDLLDREGINSVYDLKNKLPSIVVCVDEVRLLKKERDVMDILEEISSIGRSLGIFIILSMQRPDSKLLEGALKVNCTVRMGFQTADKTNSKIIGTPGAEKLNNPGRMVLKINSHLQEIQAPWLENDEAKKLLSPYKKKKAEVITNDTSIKKGPTKEYAEKDNYNKVVELFNS